MAKSTGKSAGEAADTSAPVAPRTMRETAINEARRSLILDAARSAFLELGLDGASLREIAKRAGYTPGAIYSYFSSREDIYAALLGESLERLKQCVDGAAADDAAPGPDAPATASA
ncbi:MAG TPA: helix-turn-helix domain-containing protein, partial [Methyloversatilis sp.]